MSDSDEWDREDLDVDDLIQQQEKAKKKAELEELGLSDEEEKAETAAAEAKARAAEKARKAAAEAEKKKQKESQIDVPLSDKKAEAARKKKLQEEADARMGQDAFSGFEMGAQSAAAAAGKEDAAADAKPKEVKVETVIVDAWDKVELNTHKDIDDLLLDIFAKVEKAKLKGAGAKVLVDMFKQMNDDLELSELDSIDKGLTKTIREMKTLKAEKSTTGQTKSVNSLNKNSLKASAGAHLDEVYGDGGDEWDDEDWAEWEKKA